MPSEFSLRGVVGIPTDNEQRAQGLLHPVEDLGGVGKRLAAKLAAAGAGTVEELLALASHDPEAFGDAVSGITPRQLRLELLPQARFLRLPGVNEHMAVALVRAGHTRYSHLVAVSTGTLHTQLVNELGERKTPDEVALAQLQLAAGRALLSGVLLLRVYDARTREPLPSAKLTLRSPGITTGPTAVTRVADASGLIVSPPLRAMATHTGIVEADGHHDQPIRLTARGGGVGIILAALEPGEAKPTSDDFTGNFGGLARGRVSYRIEHVKRLRDIPAGTPVRIVDTHEVRTVSLVSLWRRRNGSVITVPAFKLKRELLPARARPGDVFEVQDDATLKRLAPGAVARLLKQRDGLAPRERE